jgi:hypothetical protein
LPNRPFRSTAEARNLFEAAPSTVVKGVAAGR